MAEMALAKLRWPFVRKPVFVVVPRRQIYFVAFALLLLATYIVAPGGSRPTHSVLREEDGVWKIAIDAGHGGPDPGAVGAAGTLEKDVALAIALKLDKILRESGYATVMTRTDDTDLVGDRSVPHRQRADLIARAELVNGSNADLFVSLHANSFENPALRGAQTFHFTGDEGGRRLATHIQNALVRSLAPNNRRIASADFRILNDVLVPAVVVEAGFLTNAEEERLLNDADYQQRVAQAVADGIASYVQEQRRLRPSPEPTPGRKGTPGADI